MTFDQWWDSLPETIPHHPKEVARMAWDAATKDCVTRWWDSPPDGREQEGDGDFDTTDR